jgi:hypothetical protein
MMPSERPGMEPLLSKPPCSRDTNERIRHTNPWKRQNPFDLHRPEGAQSPGSRLWETLGCLVTDLPDWCANYHRGCREGFVS